MSIENDGTVNPASRDDVRDAYLSQYFGADRHSVRAEQRRLHSFEHNYGRHLPPPGTVCLEIGPGKGEILQWFHRHGYDAQGVDVSSEVVDYCNRLLPGSVDLATNTVAWLMARPAQFDAVLMLHVLEHIPKEQVVPLLRAIHTALRPSGCLIVEVPNMSAAFVGLHLRYVDWTHEVGFTPESLRSVLSVVGFNDVVVGAVQLPQDRWYRFLQRAAQQFLAVLQRLAGLAIGVSTPSIITYAISAVVKKRAS
jgi:2-polyprenyl-3-methyl-5-hydroxy-6-metoxy-1,4-benzoquinol methylase